MRPREAQGGSLTCSPDSRARGRARGCSHLNSRSQVESHRKGLRTSGHLKGGRGGEGGPGPLSPGLK